MRYSSANVRNNFEDELRFDEDDWFSLDQNLFEEFDFFSLNEDQDADFIQDQPPPPATNELVADIRGALLQHGTPDQRNRKLTRSFVAHTVERQPQQSAPTGKVGSLVDVSFIGRDGKRVNLEVDRTSRIHTHRRGHIRAMQEAVNHGHLPGSARSVFVGMNNQGQIQQVRHIHYERTGNRVVAVEDANVTFSTPLTAEQAVRQGVLDNPRAAQRQGQPASASSATVPPTAASRTQAQQSRNQRTVRRSTNTTPPRRSSQGTPSRSATPARPARRRSPSNRFDASDDFFESSFRFY